MTKEIIQKIAWPYSSIVVVTYILQGMGFLYEGLGGHQPPYHYDIWLSDLTWPTLFAIVVLLLLIQTNFVYAYFTTKDIYARIAGFLLLLIFVYVVGAFIQNILLLFITFSLFTLGIPVVILVFFLIKKNISIYKKPTIQKVCPK